MYTTRTPIYSGFFYAHFLMRALALLFVLVDFAQTHAQVVAPRLSMIEQHHDFGDIVEGEQVSYRFRFENTGGSPLLIQNVSSPCGCTVPDWPKTEIAPSDTGSIPVVFNSTGRAGPFVKKLVVRNNGKSANVVISVAGIVVKKIVKEEPKPLLIFERQYIDLGELKRVDYINAKGDLRSIQDSFKFTNKGLKPWVISEITSTFDGLTARYPKGYILPGETNYIIVDMTLETDGSFNRFLTIKSNTDDIRLMIHGTIKPPVGPIAYFPTSIKDFDTLKLGEPQVFRFPIINYGDQPLIVYNIDSSSLSSTYEMDHALDYGDTLWVSVTMPANRPGQFEYDVVIWHNGRQKSKTIKLIGAFIKQD